MRTVAVSAALFCLICAGSAPAQSPAPAIAPGEVALIRPPGLTAAEPSSYPGLVNVVAYAKDFYSGSAPEGAAGFETLRALGVKTIISVDGAAPDVAAAKAAGLKYIHLPIGYNGMDRERTLEIAKAVRLGLAKGPVYIHCHHGKHRAAGAAGAAAVTLGLLTNDGATEKLHVSGTAANYTGLYRCVSVAQIASAADLDAVSGAFPEVWKTSGFVNTMVDIDEAFDHLKLIETAGWSPPKDHPDLVPAAEAGRLADHFRVLVEDPKAASKPAEFRDWLGAASRTAGQIEDRLAGLKKGAAPDAAALSAGYRALGQSCKDCHAKYRD